MRGQRAGALAAVAMIGAAWPLVGAPSAAAITPPVVDPLAVPDGTPGPDEPMEQKFDCIATGLIAGTDPAAVPGSQAFMNLPRLWESAGRGAGVSVALIDTGVWPNSRLPKLRGGGDFVMAGGDGLQDCDSHGTTVAAIIAGSAAEGDGLVGVAPEAELISIRQSSQMFKPVAPSATSEEDRRAGTVSSLARAVVAAADSGARVINMSIVSCIPVLKPVDQTTLGAALRYAAVEKDAVVVAASGNTANPGCAQNPNVDATSVEDPRNWGSVVTISTPSWFSNYVLSVSATNNEGQPAVDDQGTDISLGGPWVGVGAPGLFVEGVNQEGNLIDGTHDSQTNSLKPMSGTSFSAAYVSGLAALIRAKYPDLPAHQVINRIKQTAHSPAAVVDNRIGYGVIDPVAALNYDVPPIPTPRENLSRPFGPQPAPAEPDRRPMVMALVGTATLAVLLGAVLAVGAMSKSRRG
ncbi:type VII secretion-associated serine protease mycosin [Mycobacterium neglectum]|uniref:type VII secretion-associated serine protease mycosin n=1 Tax=Mycobacterium neglectum TaxID=242737 RepID=UPI000BFEB10E|nr:type VII secretion-associated serine protease mycosin [Mycobacterium neglectum]